MLSKNMDYFRLNSYCDGGRADKDWQEKNIRRFSCGHYDGADEFYDSVTVDTDNFDRSCSVGWLSIPNMNCFRSDIYEILRPVLEKVEEARFGVLVNNKTGKVFVDWKSFWMPSIRIRGDQTRRYWKCETCGKQIYPTDGRCSYLVKAEVRDRPLLVANSFLILREDVCESLRTHPDWKKVGRKIRLPKIRVLEKPIDNYPIDLSEYEPEVRNINDVSLDGLEEYRKREKQRRANDPNYGKTYQTEADKEFDALFQRERERWLKQQGE